jgi:hypothetical protein
MADKSEENHEAKAKPVRAEHQGKVQRFFSLLGTYGVGIVACFLVILLIVVISVVLYKNGGVLKDLSDPANARGIITFMISLAAIGLAFLMVLHGLFGKSDAEQFRRAREIYAGLMGVLGTIVGFYFGSTEKPAPPLTVTEPRLMEREFITQAGGGVPPYRYRITPDTLSGMSPSEEKFSQDGWIQLKLKSDPGSARINVEVWDSKNAFVTKSMVPEKRVIAAAGEEAETAKPASP